MYWTNLISFFLKNTMQQNADVNILPETAKFNVTLRMLYISVVVVALFVTCGFICAVNEDRHHVMDYPFAELRNGLRNTTSFRKRREETNSVFNKHPKHFRLPNDSVLNTLSDLTLNKVYTFYINHTQILCDNVTTIGHDRDEKKICEYDINNDSCLALSVGYDLSFDFELQVRNRLNCDIYVLHDPRFKNNTQNDGHLGYIPEGVVVHEMLDTGDEERKRKELLRVIRKWLQHSHRIIDVLKMDVYGEEWKILPVLLNLGFLKHVRQLLIKVYFGSGSSSKCEDLKILRHLYEAGFRIFFNKNKQTGEFNREKLNFTETNVNEMTFINTRVTHGHRYFKSF